MKKTWNSPEVQELTIQATAHGHYKGHGGEHYKGHGDGGPEDKKHGYGSSDLCRCDGGTSPCNKHHGWDEDLES